MEVNSYAQQNSIINYGFIVICDESQRGVVAHSCNLNYLLQRLREEDCKFKFRLGNLARPYKSQIKRATPLSGAVALVSTL